MDQSTQVNFFPTAKRRPNMTRYNTSAELSLATRNLNANWVPMKPLSLKHRSLNLSTETFQRSKVTYQSETSTAKPSPTISESSVSQHWKEKSPHHTPGPTSTYPPIKALPTVKSPQKQSLFPASSESCRSCKCCDEDYNRNRGYFTNSPEGLSWRRLHMSRAKLKATATTSELLSGFAMIAMVELQINVPTTVPQWLFVLFAICTTVLVAVHIFALMISTYILPNIDAISKLDMCELVSESPHERMRGFIELAWAFSTILGLFLFLIEVTIICWVKFWDYSFDAAIASTVIVIPVLVIFVLFAVHFFHSLVVYRCDTSLTDLEKLEDMKRQLDEISNPV